MCSSSGARDGIAFDVYAHAWSVAEPARGQTTTGLTATLPRVRSPLVIGVIVFVVACGVFAVARAEPQPPYPKQHAVAAAQRDERGSLAGSGWDRARVIPLDRTHWRVTFFDGPREVLDAAVGPDGRVDATEVHKAGLHPPGSTILWNPAALLMFAALFVVAVAVRPLRSLRNLDALVVGLGFTLSALLVDQRLVAAHVYVGAAALAYVAVRCAAAGFGDDPAERMPLAPIERYVPLITWATLLAVVMIVVTSTGISDVAFAGLTGGTLLNHGVSPYGHITNEIVHGDTYPLLTYVLYMPVAAITPVRDSFDSLDGALWLNAVALLAAAALAKRWGTRSVLAWLAFPPVLLAASGGGNDVPAAAFTVAALALLAREQLSVALLMFAGWVKIAPAAVLIPLLARMRRATLLQALAIITTLLAVGLVAMLAVGGTDSIDRATNALRFQFERGSWFSLWRQLSAPAVQVALQALTVAFAVAAAVAVRRRPELSTRQLAGLGGAIVALIQLSANYWTFAYLPWLLPFMLVALFPTARRSSPPSEPSAP